MSGALLALLAAAAHAQAAGCPAAYKPEYAEDWQTTRSAWEAACARGLTAADVLREVQRGALARCAAKYRPYEESGKVPKGLVGAYCAQGADGRRRLAEAAGLPPEPGPPAAPPPSPRIPPRKPGSNGMGPVGGALAKAREAWRPDACLSGVLYIHSSASYVSCEESYAAKRERRPEVADVTMGLDRFEYFFSSPGSERDVYRVSYAERFKPCPDEVYTKGPDHENAPKPAGFSSCQGSVTVDVGQAVDIALRNGWRADLPVRAYLASLPPGFFKRACGGDTRGLGEDTYGYAVTCGDWDQAKLRRAVGGPVWVLSSPSQTAFIDAATGRFRYLGVGSFTMSLPLAKGL